MTKLLLSISSVSHWIQSGQLPTYVRESALFYPMILTTHLACIAFFGGLILMTDLRLLGVVMKSTPAPVVIAQLRPLKWIGFVIMVTCGILLATAKMDLYYPNPYFQLKLTLLALVGIHAWIFHRSVFGKTAPAEGAPAKLAGALSLVLWTGILSLGRWIAYYEPPK
jgi:hypothetical protein